VSSSGISPAHGTGTREQGVKYLYRSHATYCVMQFCAVLMTVHHFWSRSRFEPHMSSLCTFKITTLWGGIGFSPQGRTVREATTYFGSTQIAAVKFWTQRVRKNLFFLKRYVSVFISTPSDG